MKTERAYERKSAVVFLREPYEFADGTIIEVRQAEKKLRVIIKTPVDAGCRDLDKMR